MFVGRMDRESTSEAAILTYHSLDSSGSVLSTPPSRFKEQMQWLSDRKMPVLPLAEAWKTPGSIALTFDDGYTNFLEAALPVLERHGFPSTVFVPTGFLGGKNSWPGQMRGIPALDIMDRRQTREAFRRGATIGAHGVTHANLSQVGASKAEEELRRSKEDLEQIIGDAVNLFGYPFGNPTRQVRDLASRYFQLACGTRLGYAEREDDPFDLPRLDTYYLRKLFWFQRMNAVTGKSYIRMRGWLRQGARCMRRQP
ncbi:MAG: polysaccharide deacetylase family protein [Acidobacteriia bacterium]|nr:polysaccharide deacetylase family protein [Terriglobia bacterium]